MVPDPKIRARGRLTRTRAAAIFFSLAEDYEEGFYVNFYWRGIAALVLRRRPAPRIFGSGQKFRTCLGFLAVGQFLTGQRAGLKNFKNFSFSAGRKGKIKDFAKPPFRSTTCKVVLVVNFTPCLFFAARLRKRGETPYCNAVGGFFACW